jgi:hypothetical protein
MKDPDVIYLHEAMDAVSMYEWALGDNVGIHTDWHIIENVTSVDNRHVCFSEKLNNIETSKTNSCIKANNMATYLYMR